MNHRSAQLSATIAALEAQRSTLGDAVVDTALAPLRRELVDQDSRGSPTQQRLKQVTVLFVDVVGSTAMGQHLEPEEIHAVMDGALERFTATVKAHFGRVLQYTGDGMLAVFGADEANEVDVESAVLAGLAIIEDSRSQSDKVRDRYGLSNFAVRAGLHTGTVLLGGGVDAEGNIRGSTVNVAARMEQSAPPGRLRISHETYRHVRGLFEVSEAVLVQVKGIEQPLRSYLVERAKPRALRVANRGIDGVGGKMVGRDAELELVRAAFDAAGVERRSCAITIVGEAGIGKSRFLAEFQQTLDMDGCWLLIGRAHPRSALHPYGVLRDMLLGQSQIGEDDSGELAREKLIGRLAPLFPEEGEAPIHLIGHLIGLDFSFSPHVKELVDDDVQLKDLVDDAQFRDRAFDACLLCLRRLSESRPVVVVLDDLHWADAQTVSFMRKLLDVNKDTPLLTLIMTRPTLFEQDVQWAEDGVSNRRLDLLPLDKELSQELVNVLLQRIEDIPDTLRAAITDGAEGNPFYMEELVKMLVDDGVIDVQADRWLVRPENLFSARVPTTLTAVLQARLDALGARERLALQHASVAGHVFWVQALAAIDPDAVTAIPLLLRKQLVVRRDSQLDSGEFVFQHHLLHQVTYASVLKEQRQRGHERVGAFWSARAEVASAESVTPAACRALAEAHDHCRIADPKAFVAWFDGQFSNYVQAQAGLTLRPLVQSVVELCERQYGPDHVETARALTNLARVGATTGELNVAEPALRRALAIQERKLGNDHFDTASALRHSVVYLCRGGGKRGFRSRDLGQDVGGTSSPDERLRIDVVMGDIQIDGQLQLGHAGEAVAPDALIGDVAEEALDHVQPRCARRSEVHDEARVPRQPLLNLGVAVRGVVVHDQMQRQMLGRAAIDEPQELEPFTVAMPRLAHRDHAAVERVERCEQRCRAMALVVVGDGAGTPALHRQTRLRAVQRLDLALLIATEHEGMLGRVQVQPHDIDQLVLEVRIARDLEGPAEVRLQAVALPDPTHGRGTRAQVLGQRAGAPVRGVGRLLMQRDVHDARLHLSRDRGRTTRARRVLAKRIDAAVQETLPPQRHLAPIQPDFDCDVLVLLALGGKQDHLRPLLQSGLYAAAPCQNTKLALGVLVQFNRFGNPHRSRLLGDWSMLRLISSITSRALH
jgi:class 3 adenylate cyclase